MYSLSGEPGATKPAARALSPAGNGDREIELKFRIPAGCVEAVRQAVATGKAETVRLQARYFDTPDRRLAAAGIALRLRKEGGRWVQTLKSRGDGLMQRGEHDVELPGTRRPAAPDQVRHAGTAAGMALAEVLGQPAAELAEIFATDIRRTRRQVREAGGAVVEVAFDEGEIRAGGARLPVCELELELLRGPPAMLAALAQRWVRRHGLWLDPRSKAERGERLARGGGIPPAVHAVAPPLQPWMSGAAALRAMLASALAQVLGNACELADGGGTPEHLHQCRVGLRRLRCALHDFAGIAGDAAPAEAAGWQQALRELLARLGGARDRDALQESLLPQLAAAGAPFMALPPAEARENPAAVLCEPHVNRLWLAVLGYVHAMPPGEGAGACAPPLPRQVRERLARLHRRVREDAARFATLDEAAQHRARKRLKRLRYGAEFCSALYPAKAVARYLAVLRPAQDALGEAHDLVVARELLAQQLASEPRAWFALGWMAARSPLVLARCGETLAAAAGAPRFWQGAR